jgi:hypothetical protein
MTLETIEPDHAVPADCKYEFASREHLVEFPVNQGPWPVFEEIILLYHLLDAAKIPPQHYVLKEFLATTYATISQNSSTLTQGGCTGFVQTDSEYLAVTARLHICFTPSRFDLYFRVTTDFLIMQSDYPERQPRAASLPEDCCASLFLICVPPRQGLS